MHRHAQESQLVLYRTAHQRSHRLEAHPDASAATTASPLEIEVLILGRPRQGNVKNQPIVFVRAR